MSLSRKLLESMGLEADKVSTIIEAHAETVDSLKSQIADFKAKAEKYDQTQSELDKIKKDFDEMKANGGDWQRKYESVNEEFETFKKEQNAKEIRSQKDSAYRKLLKETGISEKRIDSIMKLTDLESFELEDGQIKDSVKAIEGIKAEWGEFITQTDVQTPKTQTPPKNDSLKKFTHEEISKMSPDEINANWDSIKESMKN